MEPLTPGEVFRNRYLVQHMLGQGGFAAVFAAEDMTIGRRVAIKVLTSGSHHNSAARFMREARVIASLTSPHTIRLFDFGKTESGTLYMVFEHVEGVDLRTMIARHGAQPPVVVQHVLQQLLSALAEAHTAGVLHRDIKPARWLA